MSSRPLFIVGCDRSGTTLLRLMLTRSPQLHILHETGFLRTLREEKDTYGDFTHPRQRWYFIRDLQHHRATTETYSFSAFDLTDEEAEASLAGAAPVDFAGAARALFQAAAHKKDASRWGDKTPRHVLILPWLAEAFPEAQFLHIIRDGRDVAASFRRAGWKSGNLRAAAQTWCDRVEAGREAGAQLPSDRYREVRYETLVYDPENTLQALCEWLDLPFTPAMLRYHKKSEALLPDAHEELYEQTHRPVDPSRAQAWKHELASHEVADIEDVAGELLKELNYGLTGAGVPLWLRGLRVAHRNTASYTRKLVHSLKRLGIG